MKVRDLLNALDTLTGGRTQNMDLDVLIRASQNDGDDLLIASDITLTIEETCADEDTLFIDVSDEQFKPDDTIPAPPPCHLSLVRTNDE